LDAEQIRTIDVLTGQINAIPGVSDPGDAGLGVVFKMHSHFDDAKTRAEGRPIFEMKTYILITIPGDTTGNVFRPAQEWDKKRFPEQWLRFQAGQVQAAGTPLSEWAQVTRAQVDELAFFNITTVEQLAVVSDVNCQRFMGLSQMREMAKKYLDRVHDEAPMLKVQAELVQRDEQISTLQMQIAQMQAILEEVQAKQSVA
jgi:hypothetical protein